MMWTSGYVCCRHLRYRRGPLFDWYETNALINGWMHDIPMSEADLEAWVPGY